MERVKKYFSINKVGIVIAVAYFLISILGRFTLNSVFDSLGFPDADGYILLAQNLLYKHLFSLDGITKYVLRTPGYPFIIAIVYALGGGNTSVIVIQYFLGAMILFLTYRIARIVDANKIATGIALALTFCDFLGYIHHGYILSETTFSFTVVLGLFFWIKYLYECKKTSYITCFSICMAVAVLIRPILRPFLFVLIFVFAILFIAKVINIKSFIIYTLIVTVTIGGWCFRNMQVTGTFEYDYRVKFDLYRVLARNVENYRLGFADPDPTLTNGIEHVQPYLEKYLTPEEIEAAGREDIKYAAFCEQAAKDYISEHKFDTLKLCLRSTCTNMLGPMNEFWRALLPPKMASLFAHAYTGLLLLIYLLYGFSLIKNRKRFLLVDLSTLGYILYMIVASSTNFGSRYRLGFIYVIYIAIICAFKQNKELSVK